MKVDSTGVLNKQFYKAKKRKKNYFHVYINKI